MVSSLKKYWKRSKLLIAFIGAVILWPLFVEYLKDFATSKGWVYVVEIVWTIISIFIILIFILIALECLWYAIRWLRLSYPKLKIVAKNKYNNVLEEHIELKANIIELQAKNEELKNKKNEVTWMFEESQYLHRVVISVFRDYGWRVNASGTSDEKDWEWRYILDSAGGHNSVEAVKNRLKRIFKEDNPNLHIEEQITSTIPSYRLTLKSNDDIVISNKYFRYIISRRL